VAGGYFNDAANLASVIAGGGSNTASGEYSVACLICFATADGAEVVAHAVRMVHRDYAVELDKAATGNRRADGRGPRGSSGDDVPR
jgi:hypothetical protein